MMNTDPKVAMNVRVTFGPEAIQGYALLNKSAEPMVLRVEDLSCFHSEEVQTPPGLETLQPPPGLEHVQPPPGLELPAQPASKELFEAGLPAKIKADLPKKSLKMTWPVDVSDGNESEDTSLGPEADGDSSHKSEISSLFDITEHRQLSPSDSPRFTPPSADAHMEALAQALKCAAEIRSRGFVPAPSPSIATPSMPDASEQMSVQHPVQRTKLSAKGANSFVPLQCRMPVSFVPLPFMPVASVRQAWQNHDTTPNHRGCFQ